MGPVRQLPLKSRAVRAGKAAQSCGRDPERALAARERDRRKEALRRGKGPEKKLC